MARDLRLDISGDASRARQALAAAEDGVGKLRRETDRLESEFRQANREAASLDRQLLETAAAAKALGAAYAQTGDPAVLKQLRAQRSELSQVAKIRKDYNVSLRDGLLAQVANHEAAVAALKAEYLLFAPNKVKTEIKERQSAIKSLQRDLEAFGIVAEKASLSLGSVFEAGGKASGGALGFLTSPAGLATAAGVAPLAGAAIGGATLAGGGIAGAGIAAAAAASAAPAQVGAAWSAEIEKIKKKWIDAGQAGVEPTIAAIHALGDAFDHINLDKIVSQGAKYLEPLAKAAGAALTYIAAGVETLIENAGPEMAVLAKEVPETGRAIKEALEAISSGSEGGARGLTDLFHVTQGVIVGTGNFIGGLETVYGWLGKASDGARHFVGSFNPIVHAYNEATDQGAVVAYQFRETSKAAADATGTFNGLAVASYNTADAADAANAAFSRLFGEAMSLDEANLAVKEGMLNLTEELKKNGTTLDSNTQKGIDNQQAILGQIQLLDNLRQSAINAGNGTKEATDAANEAYARQVEDLKNVLRHMGYTEQAIDNLIGKYQSIPDIDINVNTYYHNFYSSSNSPIGPEERKYGPTGKNAAGTPFWRGGMTWVGEQGPELVNLPRGSAIYSAPMSARIASTPQTVNVVLTVAGTGNSALASLLMKMQRTGELALTAV